MLVTPEEAYEIGKQTYISEYNEAKQIYEYVHSKKMQEGREDEISFAIALMDVYVAGIIKGKRLIRKKKKPSAHTTCTESSLARPKPKQG